MKLIRRLAGDCPDDNCAAVYLSDRGTLVAQGDAVAGLSGLVPGPGEEVVELPIGLIKEALRALER